MLLLIELLFAALPLLAIVGIAWQGWLTTVDGLFTSLILLAISGIFGLTALFELRTLKKGTAEGSGQSSVSAAQSRNGTVTEKGTVLEVSFYETYVGMPDRSVVTFKPDKAQQARMLFFLGNVKDNLPVGRRVAITYRPSPKGSDLHDLVERKYL